MSDIAISIENLSKRYVLGHQREKGDGLRHGIEEAVRSPLRWFLNRKKSNRSEEFWALKNVSFDVKQGEVVGIIGRNGAGKSTLLKIVSRITEPTEGRVRIQGRVASLLEVGTGFHPELTGRENVFLNGAILGMARSEIRQKFDEIVAFAEIEKFLDTPVKRYSSGMYVRLAFAVAAHLEPEVLIVDEVLAVGDAEFQKKCLGKMRDVSSRQGRTVLFVSHQIATIQALCSRCAVLANGEMKFIGQTDMAIKNYLPTKTNSFTGDLSQIKSRQGAGDIQFTNLELKGDLGRSLTHGVTGDPIEFHLRVKGSVDRRTARIGLGFMNDLQAPLFLCSTETTLGQQARVGHGDTLICRIPRLPLGGGSYGLTLFLETNGIIQDIISEQVTFDVEDRDFFGHGKNCPKGWEGKAVLVDHAWEIVPQTNRVQAHA